METIMSRRSIVKGAALGAAAAGIASMPGVASADEPASAPAFETTVGWNAEYDVIVAGYGAGGAYAAISAAENGAKVLLMEKTIKPLAGGNSRFGQNYMAHTEKEPVVEYMKNLRGEYDLVQDDEVIDFLVDGFMTFYDWLIAHGVPEDIIEFATRPEYPELYPNEEYTGFRKITLRPDARFNAQDVNAALGCLRDIIEGMKDSIDVWYDAPAVSLVQDSATKIVHGVKTTHDGADYTVRAKNGVVLAVGGFENNPEMIQNFTGYSELLPKGCNYNTGDGVVMAQEVGAQLWHMPNCAAPDPNFLNPYTGCAFGWGCAAGAQVPPNAWYGTMGQTSTIFVAGDGTRFMNEAANETRNSRHGQTYFHGSWVHMPWPANTWMVFDEQARTGGYKPYLSWSEGLEQEIADGWIIKGDTLDELGEQIGIDAKALSTTIDRYNAACEAGVDEEWGRQVECLVPFSGDGPFYAVKIQASVTNTDGGPKRNTRCEVLNPRDEPIPHLYSAGTCGSFWVGCYNGGGNMGENYVTGTEAGKNAAAIKDDVTQDSVLTKEAVNFADTYEVTEYECAENQYIGRYAGMNGKLTVRVTLDGKTIANVEVLEHNETPNVGTLAVDQLPQRIIDAQSTLVDTVAGATRTSAGIILATEAALRAGGVEVEVSDVTTATLQ